MEAQAGQTAVFNRRSFLAAGGGALGAAAFAGATWQTTMAQAANEGRRKPNIIIFLTDDLGYGVLGCYGQAQIKTPTLDRLATEGVRYTDFYAGASVCAPSRCTLLTGMHTGTCTVRANPTTANDDPLLPDEVTFGHLLQSQGYKTALFGKWGYSPDAPGHYSHPNPQGFEEFYGYLTHLHAHQYYPTHLWHNQTRVNMPENNNNANVTFAPDLFQRLTLDFIETNKDNPFMVLVSTNIPHAPQMVPDYGPYADRTDWGEGERAHAAQITRMDGHAGQIVSKLKQLGIEDDTVFIFLSDNGPHEEGSWLGIPLNPDFFDENGPLRGYKRNLHEGGIRTPAIVWAPGYTGSKTGTEVTQPLAFWDILPTLADLAGAPVPPFVDGGSLRHTFDGTTPADRSYRPPLSDRALYWWRVEPHATTRANAAEGGSVTRAAEAVRQRNWKAIRFAPAKDRTVADELWDFRLYNLAEDVGENNNLASQYPQVAASMLALMKQEWTPPPTPREPWSPSGLVIVAPETLPVGATTRVVVRFDNHEDKDYTRVDVKLAVPASLSVNQPRRSRAAIRPGESRDYVFEVTAPAGQTGLRQLTATATYLYDGCEARTATAKKSVNAAVPPPADLVRIPTTGWTFTASSETDLSANGRGGRAQHSFDGNLDTFWHSQWTPTQTPPPHWITAASPTAVTLRQVRYTLRSDMERPRTLYVKSSNDGQTWSTIATETYVNGTTAGPTQNTVNVPATSAQYIRLETGADGTYEASLGHFVIREIEFWG